LRTIVLGTGGLGGYFGGLMARSGQEVGFVARGEHLRALREHGLRVRSVHGDFELPIRVSERAADLGPADLVLFCVKSFDTEVAAEALRPVVQPGTAVLSLQNGVDNEDKIDRLLGPGTAMGGLAQIEATIAEPGVIAQMSQMQRLTFGELDGRRSERAERSLAAFQHGGIDAHLVDDVRQALWQKFAFITAMAGLTTLARQPIGPIMQLPETAALFRSAVEECVAVGRACGVYLPDDTVDDVCGFTANLAPGMKSSMQRDLEKGRPIELEGLNGTVVRLGRERGVPTPTHACIYGCLKLIVADG